ncbi:MAG: hypothetical protein JWM36_4700 [Hyphomicrobiales bacterium]|nr:hypothetical protein [Hyphomicrobiales bacterium]
MNTQYDSTDTPPQPVSRLGLYLPVGLLVVAALLWSGFWWLGLQTAASSIDRWLSAEASVGREWSCNDRTLGGYPFRLELRCSSVSLQAIVDGKPSVAKLGGLTIVAQIYNPKLALADLEAPLAIDAGAIHGVVKWDSLRVSLRVGLNQLQRVSLVAAQPSAQYTVENGENYETRAQGMEIHLRSDGESPAQGKGVDVSLMATGAEIPPLDVFAGTTDKTDVSLTGLVSQVTGLRAGGWRSSLETWRNQGGHIDVQSARVTKGTMRADISGLLDLDAEHRVQGKLTASAIGAAPLLAKLGMSSGGPLKQALGGLLGKRADAFVGAATSLQWPVRFQDGRVFVGPLKTPMELRPLY